MSDELTQRGLDIFGELMGEQARAAMSDGLDQPGFGRDVAKIACEFAFASTWGREGLERKQRSLVVISILIAQRQTSELRNHIHIALNNGLTAKEIEETLIQSIPYVGFPAASSAMTVIIEVLRARGVDTSTSTSEERGLL